MMRKLVSRVLAASALLACLNVYADQVTMKNGDRLSGGIVRFDGKNLVFKSEFAGEVTIPWDSVVGLESQAPLHVGLKDQQIVVGTIATYGADLQVKTVETGPVTAPREAVTSIRSKAEQEAYDLQIERLRNPRLVDLWVGQVDLGFAQTRGNAKTSNVTVSAEANRVTSRDKIGVRFTSINASNSTTGTSITTANAIRGGISYGLNLTPKLYTFGQVDLEYDEFQSLDLRFAPSGGFGYHAVRTEATVFDILGGAGMNREFFSTGLNRTSGEALLGQEWTQKLNKVTTLAEKLVFYPNLTDTGTYRVNFDTSLNTAIRRWLSWQLTVSDRYLSNPVSGRKRNDVLFTMGFRIKFAK
jgi:putative salt-induced outer membrane protein